MQGLFLLRWGICFPILLLLLCWWPWRGKFGVMSCTLQCSSVLC